MNNLQILNTFSLTMSSLEISILTDKEHKNVMRDIRKLLEDLNELKIELVEYKDSKGEMRPMYNLDKEATLTLISGYNSILRNKIIKRWQELENEKSYRFNLPTTYEEALEDLLFKVKENRKLEQQVKYLEPFKEKVDKSKVIFNKKEPVYDQERGFKKDVKDIYPFLNNTHISLILDYYTTSKYKDTDHYIKSELDCVSTFFTEADMKVSTTKDTVIVKHPCLLTNTMRIRKDKAIEYLDYTEEEFE